MNDYDAFIEIAEEDLTASILLFSKGLNSQALFSFQQSVEKVIKYLGIKDKIIEPDELERKIGHKSNKIFKKAILKYEKLGAYEIDYDVDKVFNELSNLVEKVPQENSVELIFKNIIEIIENNPFLLFDIQSIKSYNELTSEFEILDPSEIKADILKTDDNKNFMSIEDGMLEDFNYKLDNYIKGVMVLFCINLLTENLVSKVRYPDINTMENPKEKFDKTNPLIMNLSALHKAQEYVIETIKNNR
jgi:hypothetical protein